MLGFWMSGFWLDFWQYFGNEKSYHEGVPRGRLGPKNHYHDYHQDHPRDDRGLHCEGGSHVDQAEQNGRDRHWKPRVGREYHQEGDDDDHDDDDYDDDDDDDGDYNDDDGDHNVNVSYEITNIDIPEL